MNIQGLDYNTGREKLLMPEYGREIQKMVDYAVSLPSKEERLKCAKAIVRMVKENDPLVKATVTYPPRMVEIGADLALKGLRDGKKNTGAREVVVKSEVVTPANAAKHYFPESLY